MSEIYKKFIVLNTIYIYQLLCIADMDVVVMPNLTFLHYCRIILKHNNKFNE